jgi:hypothetical protein
MIARECRPQDSIFTLTSAGAIRSSLRIPAAVRRTRTPGGQPILISPRIVRPDRLAAHQVVSGTHQRRALGGIKRRPGKPEQTAMDIPKTDGSTETLSPPCRKSERHVGMTEPHRDQGDGHALQTGGSTLARGSESVN